MDNAVTPRDAMRIYCYYFRQADAEISYLANGLPATRTTARIQGSGMSGCMVLFFPLFSLFCHSLTNLASCVPAWPPCAAASSAKRVANAASSVLNAVKDAAKLNAHTNE